jgi:hypothetical protein
MEKEQRNIIPMRPNLLHRTASQENTRPEQSLLGPHPLPSPERPTEEAGAGDLAGLVGSRVAAQISFRSGSFPLEQSKLFWLSPYSSFSKTRLGSFQSGVF